MSLNEDVIFVRGARNFRATLDVSSDDAMLAGLRAVHAAFLNVPFNVPQTDSGDGGDAQQQPVATGTYGRATLSPSEAAGFAACLVLVTSTVESTEISDILSLCIGRHYYNALRFILARCGDAVTTLHRLPVSCAAQLGNLAAVRMLKQALSPQLWAALNLCPNKVSSYPASPLFVAATEFHAPVVRFLAADPAAAAGVRSGTAHSLPVHVKQLVKCVVTNGDPALLKHVLALLPAPAGLAGSSISSSSSGSGGDVAVSAHALSGEELVAASVDDAEVPALLFAHYQQPPHVARLLILANAAGGTGGACFPYLCSLMAADAVADLLKMHHDDAARKAASNFNSNNNSNSNSNNGNGNAGTSAGNQNAPQPDATELRRVHDSADPQLPNASAAASAAPSPAAAALSRLFAEVAAGHRASEPSVARDAVVSCYESMILAHLPPALAADCGTGPPTAPVTRPAPGASSASSLARPAVGRYGHGDPLDPYNRSSYPYAAAEPAVGCRQTALAFGERALLAVAVAWDGRRAAWQGAARLVHPPQRHNDEAGAGTGFDWERHAGDREARRLLAAPPALNGYYTYFGSQRCRDAYASVNLLLERLELPSLDQMRALDGDTRAVVRDLLFAAADEDDRDVLFDDVLTGRVNLSELAEAG